MKVFRQLLVPLVVLLSLSLVGGMVFAASPKRFIIATAGTAGALYPMGVSMAQTITDHLDNLAATAESSGGSVVNLRNLHDLQVEWGIAQSEIATFAYNGEGVFQGREMSHLRALFGTVGSWVQVFIPASSKIDSISDLKGKKVGVGSPGSGGEIDARIILSAYGLSYDDLEAVFLPNTEMVNGLRDGTLDAMVITHPLKSAALLDLTTSFDVKMISIADEKFYADHPFFLKKVVPAGTYRGIDVEVTTPYSRVIMLTTTKAKFTDQEIYDALSAIFDNREEWRTSHAAVDKEVLLETALDGIAVPLHPGAVKFYQDKGIEVPEYLIP